MRTASRDRTISDQGIPCRISYRPKPPINMSQTSPNPTESNTPIVAADSTGQIDAFRALRGAHAAFAKAIEDTFLAVEASMVEMGLTRRALDGKVGQWEVDGDAPDVLVAVAICDGRLVIEDEMGEQIPWNDLNYSTAFSVLEALPSSETNANALAS